MNLADYVCLLADATQCTYSPSREDGKVLLSGFRWFAELMCNVFNRQLAGSSQRAFAVFSGVCLKLQQQMNFSLLSIQGYV